MTLYTQDENGLFVPATEDEVRAALEPVPPTTVPSEPTSELAETPSEPSDEPSTTSGTETTVTVTRDGTTYTSGQIDAQPETPTVTAPPAADAPAQYQHGPVDDPAVVPVGTPEQAETQYQQQPEPPDTSEL